jgi:hypothetical protein
MIMVIIFLLDELNNATDESPSRKMSQEISRLIWNRKFHYRVQKNPYPESDEFSPLSLRTIAIFSALRV